jgi:hypothetical protein
MPRRQVDSPSNIRANCGDFGHWPQAAMVGGDGGQSGDRNAAQRRWAIGCAVVVSRRCGRQLRFLHLHLACFSDGAAVRNRLGRSAFPSRNRPRPSARCGCTARSGALARLRIAARLERLRIAARLERLRRRAVTKTSAGTARTHPIIATPRPCGQALAVRGRYLRTMRAAAGAAGGVAAASGEPLRQPERLTGRMRPMTHSTNREKLS